MSQKFLVWVDASSGLKNEKKFTEVGYVIKYKGLTPLVGYCDCEGIDNSKGEISAAIEALDTLDGYCRGIELDTKDCEVKILTDFKDLKSMVKCNSCLDKKLEGYRETLKELKGKFKEVSCEEIYRDFNIAHNVAALGFREATNNPFFNGILESFFHIFEEPTFCAIRGDKDGKRKSEKTLETYSYQKVFNFVLPKVF